MAPALARFTPLGAFYPLVAFSGALAGVERFAAYSFPLPQTAILPLGSMRKTFSPRRCRAERKIPGKFGTAVISSPL